MKQATALLAVFFIFLINGCAMSPQGVMVSFTFDDGYDSVYTEAYPILERYGFPGVVYMVTDNLDREGRLSLEQLQKLQNSGWEVGSHTVSHRSLPALQEEELYSEVYQSRAILEEAGFTVTTFAPPGGAGSEAVTAMVRRHYQSLRGTEEGYNTLSTDPYNLLVKATFTWTSSRDVERWVREARRKNRWLILVLHRIDNTDPEYSMLPQTLEEIAAALNRQNIPVVTVSEGLRLLHDNR